MKYSNEIAFPTKLSILKYLVKQFLRISVQSCSSGKFAFQHS